MTHSDHVVAMETVSDELLPCPFCGGENLAIINGGPGNQFVNCDDCRASTDDGSRDRAIAAWNRRAPSELLASRLAKQGWQGIESAPKDGTVILAVASQAQTPKARPAWWDGEGWVRIWKSEGFVVDGPRRWWPTHWQHMPASPSPVLGEPK